MEPPVSGLSLQPGGGTIHSLLVGLLALAAAVGIIASCGQAPPISIPTPGDDGATDTAPSDVGSTDDAGR